MRWQPWVKLYANVHDPERQRALRVLFTLAVLAAWGFMLYKLGVLIYNWIA